MAVTRLFMALYVTTITWLGSAIGGDQAPWWLLDLRILRSEGFDVGWHYVMKVLMWGGYQA